MSGAPSPNGLNGGRDARGRFSKGNCGGPGNPYSRKVGQWRSALARAVSSKDLKAIVKQLVTAAQGGDTAAARLILAYCLGPPIEMDVLMRLEILEQKAGIRK